MTKKPYEPPQMQPMRPEVWSELIRSVRAGAGGLQGSVADLVAQPLAATTEGREQELELLEEEIRTALGLLGVTSYSELTPRHLAAAPSVTLPDTFSAFPLLPE